MRACVLNRKLRYCLLLFGVEPRAHWAVSRVLIRHGRITIASELHHRSRQDRAAAAALPPFRVPTGPPTKGPAIPGALRAPGASEGLQCPLKLPLPSRPAATDSAVPCRSSSGSRLVVVVVVKVQVVALTISCHCHRVLLLPIRPGWCASCSGARARTRPSSWPLSRLSREQASPPSRGCGPPGVLGRVRVVPSLEQ